MSSLPTRLRCDPGLGEVSPLSDADFEVSDTPPDQLGTSAPFPELARSLRWEASRPAHRLTRKKKRALVRRLRLGIDPRSAHVEWDAEGRRVHMVALRCQATSLRHSLLDVAAEDHFAGDRPDVRKVLTVPYDSPAAPPLNQQEAGGDGAGRAVT